MEGLVLQDIKAPHLSFYMPSKAVSGELSSMQAGLVKILLLD